MRSDSEAIRDVTLAISLAKRGNAAINRVSELEKVLREILEQYDIHGRHLYAGTSETIVVPVFDRARAVLDAPLRRPTSGEAVSPHDRSERSE